jgi:tetratricopeptide (TPR) repeat protein
MSSLAAGSRAAIRLTEARRTLPAGAVELACHAALPVVIDPTFLNLLRINFFMDPPDDLPWTVEADLLASPLFRELGGELFEIDEDLRRLLLVSLRTRYGTERVEQVALLLERYCDEPGVWGGQPYIAQAQRLTVVGIVDPAAAISWLDDIQTGGASHVDLSSDWIVAMRGRLTAQPAAETTLGDEIAEATQRLREGHPAALAELIALDLLPGADREAIRAAQEETETPQPAEVPLRREMQVDDSFSRVEISWGRRSDDAPLPLSGVVFEPFEDDYSQTELYLDLKNHGNSIYASILAVDPAGRVREMKDFQAPGLFMLEGDRYRLEWELNLSALDDYRVREFNLSDHEAVAPFLIVVVVSDQAIDLRDLDGQSITPPDLARSGMVSSAAGRDLRDLTAIHGKWSGSVRVALHKISYSVVVPLVRDQPSDGSNASEDSQIWELEEAVARKRQLVAVDQKTFRPQLAESLHRLAASLAASDRYREAVAVGGEAVDLYREIVREESSGRLPFAEASTNISQYLAAIGRYPDALAANEEAVAMYRYLAFEAYGNQDLPLFAQEAGRSDGWERGDVFGLGLGEALSIRSQLLAALSRYQEALQEIEESLFLYRRLSERYSNFPRRELAVVLNVRSQLLVAEGRWDEALSDSREALSLYRQLVAESPQNHLPGLAATLSNLCRVMEGSGQFGDAMLAGREAIDIHRTLVQRNAPVYSPGLAAALSDWSHLLVTVRRLDEALAAGEEAVSWQRGIVETKGDFHRAGLGAALSNLSRLLAELGRLDDAAAVSSEAIALYREIPSASALVGELSHQADVLTALGRSSDAAIVHAEADDLRRSLGSRFGGGGSHDSEEPAPRPEAGRQPHSAPATVTESARGTIQGGGGEGGDDPSKDAVLFIPGIAGSELVDAETGRTLWGTSVGGMIRMVTDVARHLVVTDEERAGVSRRVVASGLIGQRVDLPGLLGLSMYRGLIAGMKSSVAHPDALLAFPYDWRLSARYNARLLAAAAEQHLQRWRSHPSGHPDARLTLVAQSLGGLVAMDFLTNLGGAAIVRRLLAIGTPFYGTVNAVTSITKNAPLLRTFRGLRTLYRSMPAIYDMMPTYRCVDVGGEFRRLTVGDVVAIGGDGELAAAAFERRLDMSMSSEILATGGTAVTTLIGIDQPTPQSFRITDGKVAAQQFISYDGKIVDRGGDRVVHRDAAMFPGAFPHFLSQPSGELTSSAEARAFIRAFLAQRPLGPQL